MRLASLVPGFGLFITPLRIAFAVQNPGNFLNSAGMQAVYILVETFFLVNTYYVEFRKGYYDERNMDLIMDAKVRTASASARSERRGG